MNTIEELIQKECPEGVEYLPLGEVLLSLNTGLNPSKFFRLNTPDADFYYVTIREIKGGYIHVDEKTDRINKNALKLCNNRSNLEIGDVLFSGTGTIGETVVIENEPSNWNIKEGVYSLKPRKEIIVSKYLVYILRSSNIALKIKDKIAGGTVKSIPMKELAKIEIPVPPLSVQHKIVEILDKFTSLEAELQAELEARKKQYEYYRNQLLDFTGREDVEWKTLGECIISLKTGLNPRQNFKLDQEDSILPYVTGKDIVNNGIYTSEKTNKISIEAEKIINKRACLEVGNLLFASTGTGTVGRMAIIQQYNHDWNISETLYNIKPNTEITNSEFLMYMLYSTNAVKQFSPKISKGSVPHLKVRDLLDVVIPIPSLTEQQRIVTILDKFEALINDQTASLAAEIKARHQQYEYYRDRLLTFSRKEN